MPVCPLCGNTKFSDYRGRSNIRCAGCGSKERGRALALTLERFTPPDRVGPVYHFAPEKSIADMLISIFGDTYRAADIDPDAYSWSRVPVEKVNLAWPKETFSAKSVRGFIHSHVLEHIPGSIDRILNEMNDALIDGGFHIFQVPVERGWYREDMNPDMSDEERTRAFLQHDHLRVFGRNDFGDRCLRLFDNNFIPYNPGSSISKEDLTEASIPKSIFDSFTGHTPFVFIKTN